MAPRGVPQIEVTFDIDANGIVHVTAQDKATNKQMSITIKSSGGLSDSQIQDMLKQAEKMKEEDRKKREMIEMKNEAESVIYNTEKQVKENEAKLSQEVKDNIRNTISALNEALANNNYDNTKQQLENLRNASMEIGKTLYQNAGQQQEQTQNATSEGENKENKDNK
jgi:molecular chaperone DnaK